MNGTKYMDVMADDWLRMFDEPATPAATTPTYTPADPNTNTTGDTGMSPTMKTYYDGLLIDNATPELRHTQFGQMRPIPKGRGKTVEFRKYNPLPKALTPLTEGVTPKGTKVEMTKLTAEVNQYGDYVTISDVLDLTAIDPQISETTVLLGTQAGMTLDTVVREVLNGGTNVQYAEGQVTSRANLVGGSTTASENHYLTVKAIRMAVRTLKRMNAKKKDGSWVGIIHPDVAYDLMDDPKWESVKNYDPQDMYEGEIGRIAGVRFVETTEAKKWAQAGKDKSTGTATAEKRDVYSTLILGADAYGVTEVEGGGLQHIVKPLGSGDDPLNQRATCGWKALQTAERLTEAFMVRIETTSSSNDGEAN